MTQPIESQSASNFYLLFIVFKDSGKSVFLSGLKLTLGHMAILVASAASTLAPSLPAGGTTLVLLTFFKKFTFFWEWNPLQQSG